MLGRVRKVGIEEEFLLVRGDRPASDNEEVVARASERGDGFEEELQRSQVELGTDPLTAAEDLRADLGRRRRLLAEAAAEDGDQIAALGTSPVPADGGVTPHARYQRMQRRFGRIVGTELTCGMHVHVDVADDEEGVGVVDRLRPWLAVLTALSANSPFLDREDTGYAAYRPVLWSQWPTAGPTGAFGDAAGYRRVRDVLVDSGAALDDGMLYFDARLSARYPTVEIRVADVCPDVDDAVTIALLARAMVHSAATAWAAGQPAPVVRTEQLRAAAWRAARHGTEDALLDPADGRPRPSADVVDALLRTVAPALEEAGDTDRVREGLAAITARGTGARLQREARERAGDWAGVLAAVAGRTTRGL